MKHLLNYYLNLFNIIVMKNLKMGGPGGFARWKGVRDFDATYDNTKSKKQIVRNYSFYLCSLELCI